MATLDARPEVVDLLLYAGDTYTLEVTAPASLTDVLTVWTAQIKAARTSDVVDEAFTITPPAVSGGPAYLTLTSAQTAGLVAASTRMTKRRRDGTMLAVAVPVYVGEWDCQVAAPSGEPLRTLVQGAITIDADVTRLLP